MQNFNRLMRKSLLILVLLSSITSLSSKITGISASSAYAHDDKREHEIKESEVLSAVADWGYKPLAAKALNNDGTEWLVYNADGSQTMVSVSDDGIVIEGNDIQL